MFTVIWVIFLYVIREISNLFLTLITGLAVSIARNLVELIY